VVVHAIKQERFGMKIVRQIVSLILACVFLASAAGCLVTSGSSTKECGVKVSRVTLNQIQPGETTEDWLIAAAGEPSSRSRVDERTSILRYDHIETRSSHGTVFLLFAGGSKKEKTTSVRFEVTDGVIQKYWTESADS
jgi:hypothetical protein